MVADEVADAAFAEDPEESAESALGWIPSAAGLDEGDVDAGEDILALDRWELAAHFAAHVVDQAAVFAVEATHAALLLAAKRCGEVAPYFFGRVGRHDPSLTTEARGLVSRVG